MIVFDVDVTDEPIGMILLGNKTASHCNDCDLSNSLKSRSSLKGREFKI